MKYISSLVRHTAGYLRSRIGRALSGCLHRQEELAFHKLISAGTVEIGKHSYAIPIVHTFRGCTERLHIGSFVSIADDVHVLLGGNHPVSWVTTFPLRIKLTLPGAYQDGSPCGRGDVSIGSDVWIGHGAVILSGVSVGHGGVIAARSVVTRDVPPYTIVAGAPARRIHERFSPGVIARLLEIAWWDWDEGRIIDAVDQLSSDDVERFIGSHIARGCAKSNA